jgi:adenylate cyclase
LGTVGVEDRLQCDVVGDTVNLAARVQEMNKTYGTEMLVSHHTLERLTGDYRFREIESLRVKGKTEPVTLFESLDALDKKQCDAREASLPEFQSGLKSYKNGQTDAARRYFVSILNENPSDQAAVYYLNLCLKH